MKERIRLILYRNTNLSIDELKDRLENQALFDADSSQSLDTKKLLNNITGWFETQQLYNGALKEISTKLEILDEEFQMNYTYNPIHHMECRLKSMHSIIEKMNRLHIKKTIPSMREHITDISGIRVICRYLHDVYIIEKMLLAQDDVTFIRRRDYIKNPKESGYRSLHLLVRVPVFLSRRKESVPVEIQLRTIPMDYWASLEHHLQYKNTKEDKAAHHQELRLCAKKLAEIEETMQDIHRDIINLDNFPIDGPSEN